MQQLLLSLGVPFEPSIGEICESLFYEIVDLRNQALFDRHISGDASSSDYISLIMAAILRMSF